ncbi:MAG TPA: FAD-dependent oxidoreductase, partial [Candidatus Ozemobacteraceae bacterium]|nr:FAD-dependent oxidoreductase [Candidatus Ozemobacteraceae bacterium]
MTSTRNRTIIVGTGIAGTSAAFAMRDAGYTGELTLIGEEPWPAYYRTRLPEMVSGEVTVDKLLVNTPAQYEEKRIRVLVNRPVHTVDADRREVQFADGARQAFDQLLIATGCRPFVPPLPGAEGRAEIFALRSAQDATRIQQFARGRRHAVVVGGGLLGLEAAFHLTKLGLSVEVIETAPRLMPRQLDRRSSQLLKERLEKRGFTFLVGAKANRFSAECCGGGTSLELIGGHLCQGDLYLISTGVVPRRELVDPLGLACERGIHIDPNGQTSVEGVFAAGDNVQFENRIWGTWMAARHWGLRAGKAMAGQ